MAALDNEVRLVALEEHPDDIRGAGPGALREAVADRDPTSDRETRRRVDLSGGVCRFVGACDRRGNHVRHTKAVQQSRSHSILSRRSALS
jgi:hypothetical protein